MQFHCRTMEQYYNECFIDLKRFSTFSRCFWSSWSGFGRSGFCCFIVPLTSTVQKSSKAFIYQRFPQSRFCPGSWCTLQKSSPAVQKSSSNRRTFGRNFSCFIVDCFCFIPQQCETMKLLLFFSLLKNVKQ